MVIDGVTVLRDFFRTLWTCCLAEAVSLDTLPEERVAFSSWIVPSSIFSSVEEFDGLSPEGLENSRKAAPTARKNMISIKIMLINFFLRGPNLASR